jgi:hypothetical protein
MANKEHERLVRAIESGGSVLFHNEGRPNFVTDVNALPSAKQLASPAGKAAMEAREETADTSDAAAGFNKFTLAELKQVAEENDVDLGDATRKADVIKALVDAGVELVEEEEE